VGARRQDEEIGLGVERAQARLVGDEVGVDESAGRQVAGRLAGDEVELGAPGEAPAEEIDEERAALALEVPADEEELWFLAGPAGLAARRVRPALQVDADVDGVDAFGGDAAVLDERRRRPARIGEVERGAARAEPVEDEAGASAERAAADET